MANHFSGKQIMAKKGLSFLGAINMNNIFWSKPLDRGYEQRVAVLW